MNDQLGRRRLQGCLGHDVDACFEVTKSLWEVPASNIDGDDLPLWIAFLFGQGLVFPASG